MAEIHIALAGQPNSGKSTIFNAITGARQFIANYPGVTVEKKTGIYKYEGDKYVIVDLPGTYSLTSYSIEEKVARNYLLDNEADMILNIVDGSNLERNLNLTLQLAEIGLPMIVALNMMDVAQKRGLEINTKRLSKILKCPVIPAVAKKGKGVDEIKSKIKDIYYNKEKYLSNSTKFIDYGEELENSIKKLENYFKSNPAYNNYSARWLAVKLLAGDEHAENIIKEVS